MSGTKRIAGRVTASQIAYHLEGVISGTTA